MSKSKLFWLIPLAIYLAFFFWYTSFQGPLTDEEIARYTNLIKQRGNFSPEALARIREFMETDTGNDFVMVNVIEMNAPPIEVNGKQFDSANDALEQYMEHMWPALFSRACHPVAAGSAAATALDIWGIDNADTWSSAVFMRYRSRRDMLEIATNPDFQGPHDYKIAAMNKTVAFPVDPWFHLGEPRLLLGVVLLLIGLLVERFFTKRPH